MHRALGLGLLAGLAIAACRGDFDAADGSADAESGSTSSTGSSGAGDGDGDGDGDGETIVVTGQVVTCKDWGTGFWGIDCPCTELTDLEGLEGVQVRLEGTEITANTDANGGFVLDDVPADRFYWAVVNDPSFHWGAVLPLQVDFADLSLPEPLLLFSDAKVAEAAAAVGVPLPENRGMVWGVAEPRGAAISSDPAAAPDTFLSFSDAMVLLNDNIVHDACFPGVLFFDLPEEDAGARSFSAENGVGACTVYGGADPPVFVHHISYVGFLCPG